jgi:ketosteroid isomerase-like protein
MTMNRRHMALAGAALALSPLAALPTQAQGSDAAAVAAAVEALTKAMLAGDRAGLMAVTHERLSYGHSAGRIENRQQFIDPLANKTSIFRSMNVSDQTIDVVGDDAIVRHVLRGESESNGRVNPVNIGILQVWKKQPDGWKLLARQAFTRPN